ncbi:hypothetical protein WMY93_033690, partial [Mugilogobius chulae]
LLAHSAPFRTMSFSSDVYSSARTGKSSAMLRAPGACHGQPVPCATPRDSRSVHHRYSSPSMSSSGIRRRPLRAVNMACTSPWSCAPPRR